MAINAPKGTRDLLPDQALFWNQFRQTATDVFGAYGYLPIETPLIEQTELFVRGIGEATDVVSKEMFAALSGENLKRLGCIWGWRPFQNAACGGAPGPGVARCAGGSPTTWCPRGQRRRS